MLKLVIMPLKKAGGSLAPENTDPVRPSMASSAFWSFVKPEQWQPGQIEKYIYIYTLLLLLLILLLLLLLILLLNY